MIHTKIKGRQNGATAIFVVMFSAMLFLIISVGFVRLMVQEQSRSTNSELSQSAYDAALAGIEDGKRVLDIANCEAGDTPECLAVKNNGNTTCNIVQNIMGIGGSEEVLLKSQSSNATSGTFDQAYTCVRIDYSSPSYEGAVPMSLTDVVWLRGVSSYDKVRISWYSRDNMIQSGFTGNLYYPSSAADISLPDLQTWSGVSRPRPTILKVTHIPDAYGAIHDTQDKTLYLHPRVGAAGSASFSLDNRRTGSTANIVPVTGCISTFNAEEYACSAVVSVPAATSSYLNIASPYGATGYKVELLDSSNSVVEFDGVQPVVDATGRAGDVFRRVKARVEKMNGSDQRGLYPRATVDITNNFCKVYSVGTVTSVYDDTIDDCKPFTAGP